MKFQKTVGVALVGVALVLFVTFQIAVHMDNKVKLTQSESYGVERFGISPEKAREFTKLGFIFVSQEVADQIAICQGSYTLQELDAALMEVTHAGNNDHSPGVLVGGKETVRPGG